MKAWMSLGLWIYFALPYLALQQVTVFPVRSLPRTWLDEAIVFQPGWMGVYLSINLLLPLALLARTREELVRYARGFRALCAVCFVIFFLFPTEAPRPSRIPASGLYAFFVRYEGARNAMPSLHAALTAYTFLLGRRLLRDDLGARGRAAYAALALAWGGAILYATLATKQHAAVDLPAGIVLAGLCHRWAWHGSVESGPSGVF